MENIHARNHPSVHSNDLPPDNVICIECLIESEMLCYPGSLHMVNTNKYLTEKKIGNGTQCKCKQIKLKSGARRVWKHWDGHKVYTVSIHDVEYVEFYHYPSPPKGASTTF